MVRFEQKTVGMDDRELKGDFFKHPIYVSNRVPLCPKCGNEETMLVESTIDAVGGCPVCNHVWKCAPVSAER